ncbi:MAG: ATP-dependent endonuclease [Ramlibacter sp.]
MRLSAFRIQNFRSVQDSGRCEVSGEDVAVLVGQNEAGKSSLLEALMAFQNCEANANDFRSDGTLPRVECEYELSEDEFKKWITSNASVKDAPSIQQFEWTPVRVLAIADWQSQDSTDLIQYFEFPEREKLVELLVSPLVAQDHEVIIAEAAVLTDPTSSEVGERRLKIIQSTKEAYEKKIDDELIESLFPRLPNFVLFNDESCLLPSTIDVVADDLENVAGKAGTKNFLTVAELDLKVLLHASERHRSTMLSTANKLVSNSFRNFWTQEVGRTQKVVIECDLKFYSATSPESKRAQPYLVFYISEANDKLYPSQRSKGVRWFLSFFLQIWASASSKKSVVFLLDEPGANLHSKAQQDVLRVIEGSSVANQVLYSTHSPDLIRADKLGRVLAVQRDDAENSSSPTTVIAAHKLSSASVDTMSAVYRAMGVDFSRQQIIQRSNNVLLEEISALYYLKAFCTLLGVENQPNFLPATGVTNVPMIASLLTGWGIEFLILLDDDNKGRETAKTLAKNLFFGDESVVAARLLRIKKCDGIEDLFEAGDFCALVLKQPQLVLNKSCSDAAKDEAKGMMAYRFWCEVQAGKMNRPGI